MRGSGYTFYALNQINRLWSLEMYQPSGYKNKKQSPKNKLAWEEAQRMAEEFGIELISLKSNINKDEDVIKKENAFYQKKQTSKRDTNKKKSSLSTKIPHKALSVLELRKNLSYLLDKIDFEQLKKLGIESKLWEKCKKIGKLKQK